MSESAARQEAAIRFLQRQSWNPARAQLALERYQAQPSEESRLELVKAVDAILRAFRESLSRRVTALLAEGRGTSHPWILELAKVSESAGALMVSHSRSWLDRKFPAQLCYDAGKQHSANPKRTPVGCE